jgi:hypothetical protein
MPALFLRLLPRQSVVDFFFRYRHYPPREFFQFVKRSFGVGNADVGDFGGFGFSHH